MTKGFSLLQTTAEEALFKQQSFERDKQEERCLQKLRGSVDYEKNKDRDRQGIRIPNTCRWVLDNTKFTDWRDGKSQGFLLITADAGCGKSVLARSLIDEKQLGSIDTVVCYYFFRHDDRREAWEMLGILLYQLFDQRPDLVKHAVPYARKDSLFSKSVSTLWKILEKVTEDESLPGVVCILDAFDEGSDDWETKRFVDELVGFYAKFDAPQDYRHRKLLKLKFIVTSRPYHGVEMAFGKLGKLGQRTRLCASEDTNPKCIRDEINLVIETEVLTLRERLNLEEGVAEVLKTHLKKMENNTYLCISLILRLVATSAVSISVKTSKRMRTFLSSIPSGLCHIYEAMLQKIPIPEEGEKVLKIVVAAVRPLSIPEMRIASSIREESYSFDDLDLEDLEDFVLRIRNQCGLFITVVDDKIYLIHQTAREFLVQKSIHLPAPSSGTSSSRTWQHSLNMAGSNRLLAWTCIRYLCFTEFDRRFRKHQFLEYASSHWVSHYRLSRTTGRNSHLLEQSLKLCNVQSNLCRSW
ncbi:hypothetical protein DL95DRAFT_312447, partial [Leptodontidium sp. 2 PMI_412]